MVTTMTMLLLMMLLIYIKVATVRIGKRMVSTQELNYTTQISSIVLYTITFTCSYREVSLT